MRENKYRLEYLPLFSTDLENIVMYIAETLNNPTAAGRFIDDVESAILNRLTVAESFEKYQSRKERKYPYYRIYVGNFIVFYVVIDEGPAGKVMQVRRLLYKGQDIIKII